MKKREELYLKIKNCDKKLKDTENTFVNKKIKAERGITKILGKFPCYDSSYPPDEHPLLQIGYSKNLQIPILRSAVRELENCFSEYRREIYLVKKKKFELLLLIGNEKRKNEGIGEYYSGQPPHWIIHKICNECLHGKEYYVNGFPDAPSYTGWHTRCILRKNSWECFGFESK